MVLKVVGVAEGRLLSVTECVSDTVASHTGDGGVRILDDIAVLDVDPVDLRKIPGGSAIVGDDWNRNDSH